MLISCGYLEMRVFLLCEGVPSIFVRPTSCFYFFELEIDLRVWLNPSQSKGRSDIQ